MSRFVFITDFEEGELCISQNEYSENDLQSDINEIEESYLLSLLGCELYDLFITDFDIIGTEPTNPIFKAIFEPFCEDETLCGIMRSEGIKQMLKYFIYFEHLSRTQANQNTTSGTIRTRKSLGENLPPASYGLDSKYNKGIKSFEAIQWFICDNSSDYPEYNGVEKDLTSWL